MWQEAGARHVAACLVGIDAISVEQILACGVEPQFVGIQLCVDAHHPFQSVARWRHEAEFGEKLLVVDEPLAQVVELKVAAHMVDVDAEQSGVADEPVARPVSEDAREGAEGEAPLLEELPFLLVVYVAQTVCRRQCVHIGCDILVCLPDAESAPGLHLHGRSQEERKQPLLSFCQAVGTQVSVVCHDVSSRARLALILHPVEWQPVSVSPEPP